MAKSWWSGARGVVLVLALALLSAVAVIAPTESAAAQNGSEDSEPAPVEPEPEEVEPDQPASQSPEPESVEPEVEQVEPEQAEPHEASAQVGDLVWIDLDRDGIQAPDEPGVPNLEVQLWTSTIFGELNDYVDETVTGPDGGWNIDAPPGSYAIRVFLPDAALGVTVPDALGNDEDDELDSDAYAWDDGTAISEPFTLTLEQTRTDVDVGIDPAYDVEGAFATGIVWLDLDRDQLLDADEPGVASAVVSLVDEATGVVVDEMVTDDSGLYDLAPPRVGRYYVDVAPADGFTVAAIGGDNDVDEGGRSAVFTLDFENFDIWVDAALVAGVGTVEGQVFDDLNADGVRGPDEPPVPFVPVVLSLGFDNHRRLFTDGNGRYLFDEVQADTNLLLSMGAPEGSAWTTPDVGDDALDSDVSVNGTVSVRVAADEVATFDGGLLTPRRVSISSSIIPPADGTWSAELEVNDERIPWDLSTVDRTGLAGSDVRVWQRLSPPDSWIVDGIVCDGGDVRSVNRVAPGEWFARIPVGAEATECEFQNRWFGAGQLDLTIEYEAPANAPTIDLSLRDGPALLRPGQQTTQVFPANSESPSLWIYRPPAGWAPSIDCTADIIERVEPSFSHIDVDFRTPVAFGSETCTIRLTPEAPVSLSWTKVYPSDPSKLFRIGDNRPPMLSFRDGDTVTIDLVAGADTIVEEPTAGTRLTSLVCDVDGVQVVVDPPTGGFDLTLAAPGAAVACVSTSELVSEYQLTLVNDVPGTPATFTVLNFEVFEEVAVDTTTTVSTNPDNIIVMVDPGPTRTFAGLDCSSAEVLVAPEDVGYRVLRVPVEGATCTLTTDPVPNPAIELTFRADFEGLVGAPPAMSAYVWHRDLDWPAEGLTLSQYVGVPDTSAGGSQFVNVTYVDPAGWMSTDAACIGLDPAVDVNFFAHPSNWNSQVFFSTGEQSPGDLIDCTITFVEATETLPLIVTVTVDGEPASGVPVTFWKDGQDEPFVGTPSEPASTVVDPFVLHGGVVIEPIPGYELIAGGCGELGGLLSGNLHGEARWPGLSYVFEEDARPDAIECSITIAATAPSQVIIETIVDGAVGPGPFTFSVAGQTVVLNGEDTATVDVAIGRNDLAVSVPPVWNEVAKSCDRDRDLSQTDDGFEIVTYDNGETITCTFTLRAANQDLGRAGDPSCDGVVDIIDALVVAQFTAQVRTSAGSCADLVAASQVFDGAADVNGDNLVDIIDALVIAQCSAGIAAPLCPEQGAVLAVDVDSDPVSKNDEAREDGAAAIPEGPDRRGEGVSDPIEANGAAEVDGESVVQGLVFLDEFPLNTRERDPGIAGVVVELLDVWGIVVASTVTDADGIYALQAPAAGDYMVVVTAPSDLRFSRANSGSDFFDSDVDANGQAIVEVGPGLEARIDAGLYPEVTVEGVFWIDENENGRRDAGEPPAVGISLGIYEASTNSVYGVTETDGNGSYRFDGYRAGTYAIGPGVLDRVERRFTTQNVGDDVGDSDIGPDGWSDPTEVLRESVQIDGGLLPSVTIRVDVAEPAPPEYRTGPRVRIGEEVKDLYFDRGQFVVAPNTSVDLTASFPSTGVWDVNGLTCDGAVDVAWSNDDGFTVTATLAVGAPGVVDCIVDARHLPTLPTEVTFVVDGPDNAPPVELTVSQSQTGSPVPSRYATTVTTSRAETVRLEPNQTGRGSVVTISALPAGWSAAFACDAPVGVERSWSGYRLDLLAVAGASTDCTITVTFIAPVTIEWTNVHTGVGVPTVEFTVDGRTAVSAGGESVNILAEPGSPYVYVSAGRGATLLESLECAVGDVVVRASIDDGRSANLTLNDIAAGAGVSCTTTTSPSPASAGASLTLIAEGGESTNVLFGSVYSSAQESVDFVNETVIETRAEETAIYLDVGPNRRFSDVRCDRFPGYRSPVQVGYFVLDMSVGDATCVISSLAQPNPSIAVNFVPVVPDGLDVPHIPLLFSGRLAPEGVIREHRLGTTVPNSSSLEGIRFDFVVPGGWRVSRSDTSCSGEATASVVERATFATIDADLANVMAGSVIDCAIVLEPAAGSASVSLAVDFGDAPPVPVSFGSLFAAPTTAAAGTEAVIELAPDQSIMIYPLPGYSLASPQCTGGRLSAVQWRADALTLFLEWLPDSPVATTIDCVVRALPVEPARIVLTHEVVGAVGNAELRFDLSTLGFDQSVVINGPGTTTVEVPATEIDLAASLPLTVRNRTVSCDRSVGVTVAGLSVEFELLVGETVECTFVNEMVSQDIGVAGDVTCDGVVDIIDALVIAQFDALVRSGAEACPLADAATELFTGAADFDGSGGIDILDALQVARCTVGLPAPACPAAPAIEAN